MNTEMALPDSIIEAAAAFGYVKSVFLSPIGQGLIHSSYRVEAAGRKPMLLQQVNTNVFPNPSAIQANYERLFLYLQSKSYFLPELFKTTTGNLLWQNSKNEVWRAFAFVPDSFSPELVTSLEEAGTVASCFGRLAAILNDFPAEKLQVILPRFHDLQWRYQQLEEALQNTKRAADGEVQELLQNLQQRESLLSVYRRFNQETEFPLRVMHHDCKISNILFDRKTKKIICPVDLDTVMPGKFFSDLGDMIRTLCCTVDENSTAWNEIAIRKDFYETIVSTYRRETAGLFTRTEKENLHLSGLFLIYMQTLRFLTDYLNGNIYYKVQYDAQNLHRAKNQHLLLQSLEYTLRGIGYKYDN